MLKGANIQPSPDKLVTGSCSHEREYDQPHEAPHQKATADNRQGRYDGFFEVIDYGLCCHPEMRRPPSCVGFA